MNDKDFNSMRQQHRSIFTTEEEKRETSPIATILGARLTPTGNKNKTAVDGQPNGTEKKPKTAIWWMIMIFCIVYGIEIVYNAMVNGPQ